MTSWLFGIAPDATSAVEDSYATKVDYTLLPITPLQPGRFKVLRDVKLSL